MSSGPSLAVSVRIDGADARAAAFQRRHDLRLGALPAYVDVARVAQNSVLIEPPSPAFLRRVCEDRRALRDTKRAMKSDAAIASRFIITFGTGAQDLFAALSVQDQDAACLAISERLARELGSNVAGLVVHRDESAPHAHVTMPAVGLDGRPLSRIVTRSVASKMQDWAAQEMAAFEPRITRGKPKADRVAAGEPLHQIVHRSVRELHQDLPRDLELARERVSEMAGKVTALQDKAALSDQEAKRLLIYTRRLQDRKRELVAVEARLVVANDQAEDAASRRVEDNVASFEAISIAIQEAGRIVSDAHDQAALIRDHAREDAASIRAGVVDEVRSMATEIHGMRVDLGKVLRASSELDVRRPGVDLINRFDDFLGRLRSWFRGSSTWSQLKPESELHVPSPEPDDSPQPRSF